MPGSKSYPYATSEPSALPVEIRDRLHPDDHLLLWCLEGRGRVETLVGDWEIPDGRALVVPAGLEHTVISPAGTIIYPVFLPASSVEVTSMGDALDVSPEVADALLLLSVAATTDLTPTSRYLDRLAGTVARLLGSTVALPSTDDRPALFIPWVTNESAHVALWCVSGEVSVTIAGTSRDTSVDLVPGLAVVVPAGRAHRVHGAPGNVTLPVFFAPGEALVDGATIVLVDVRLRRALHAQNLADNTLFRPEGWDDSALTGALAAGFSAPCEAERSRITSSVREGLLRDPSDTRGVDEWASTLGVSRRTLERAFLDETGESLGCWRDRLRMTVASSWLLEGYRAKQVTERLGFAHPSAFTRAFVRHFGVSPRKYAAAAA